MPRFFFDVCSADVLIVDEVGEIMDGPEAALSAARHLLPIVHQSAGSPTDGSFPDVSVRDDGGRVIAIATLSLAVCRFDQSGLRPIQRPAGDLATEAARSRELIANSFLLKMQVHSELAHASRHMLGIRALLDRLAPAPW